MYPTPIRDPQSAIRNPLGLYLHIPFCDHRCVYCDFNAYAGLERLMPRYAEALAAEIAAWSATLGRREVPTVFFGGGTPSLLPLPLLARVIDAVRAGFRVDPAAEWTLEANPGTVDEAYFRDLRALGVNRVSIGVQSFDDGELRRLDRIHDAAAAEAAYRAARAAGFTNVSLDLIFGLEGQSLAGWERNVRRAVALGPEHLSLYALTVEEGTPLAHRVARGEAREPDADLQADMYELAGDLLAAAGYEQYEISNWARPGYACRHNLVYWRDGEWLGLGAGAHSHLLAVPGRPADARGLRFAVVNSPAQYIRYLSSSSPLPGIGLHPLPPFPNADRGGEASLFLQEGEGLGAGRAVGEMFPWITSVEKPDLATAMADAAIMALRLSEGLSRRAFAKRFGVPFEAVYGETIAECRAEGLVECDEDRVRITAHGRLLANEVFARLLAAETPTAQPLTVE